MLTRNKDKYDELKEGRGMVGREGRQDRDNAH